MKELMNFQPPQSPSFLAEAIEEFAQGFWQTVHFHYLPHMLLGLA